MSETDAPGQDAPQGNAAYRKLLDEIRSGRLNAGDRLRETDLAERLGVSRTPIREAIRQLEADGLVTHVPRQGASLRTLDYAEVMELYEMRAVLEGTAARLAARAASDIEIEELAALNQDLAEAGDGPEAVLLNRQFHGRHTRCRQEPLSGALHDQPAQGADDPRADHLDPCRPGPRCHRGTSRHSRRDQGPRRRFGRGRHARPHRNGPARTGACPAQRANVRCRPHVTAQNVSPAQGRQADRQRPYALSEAPGTARLDPPAAFCTRPP